MDTSCKQYWQSCEGSKLCILNLWLTQFEVRLDQKTVMLKLFWYNSIKEFKNKNVKLFIKCKISSSILSH